LFASRFIWEGTKPEIFGIREPKKSIKASKSQEGGGMITKKPIGVAQGESRED
jgi:hypothetical protein